MDESSNMLKNRFNAAADRLPSLLHSLKQEQLLQFYALYKQATIGKCNTSRPNWYAFEAKQKWDAWNSLGEMAMNEAMEKYIAMMTEISGEIVPEKMPNGWVAVSTMKGEDSDLDDSEKDIFDLVKEGNVEQVKCCIGGDVNLLDEEGIGLLHWAADRGNKNIVACLLDLGGNINLRDSSGQTALHYACSCGHKDVVQFLLEKSADINIACNEGYLPIDVAIDDDIKNLLKLVHRCQ